MAPDITAVGGTDEVIVLAWEGHNKQVGKRATIAVKRSDGSVLWRRDDFMPKSVVGGRILVRGNEPLPEMLLDAATGETITGVPEANDAQVTALTSTHALVSTQKEGQAHVVDLGAGKVVKSLPSATLPMLGTGPKGELLMVWSEGGYKTWAPGESDPRPISGVIPTNVRNGVIWAISPGSGATGPVPFDRDGRPLGEGLSSTVRLWSSSYAILAADSNNKSKLVKFL